MLWIIRFPIWPLIYSFSLFWVDFYFLFIGVGPWLVGLLFGLSWAIILVGFGLVYLLNRLTKYMVVTFLFVVAKSGRRGAVLIGSKRTTLETFCNLLCISYDICGRVEGFFGYF